MPMLLFLMVLCFASAQAALVPLPREIVKGEGTLVIDAQTAVIAPAGFKKDAELVTAALGRMSGFRHRDLTVRQAGRMRFPRAIRLEIAPSEHREFYRMSITPDELTISGGDAAGLMHGVQTLIQMIPVPEKAMQRMELPCQTIEDWPEAGRRIFFLDASAHLFPTHEIARLLDWLAFHKINEFHLLLNDDYGWRMESLKFPKLHEIGSVRASTPPYGDTTGSDSREYGGYYTQANLKELAAHARELEIKLVPAFNFSNGASAILAAYPELGPDATSVKATWQDWQIGLPKGDEQLAFMKDFLTEAAALCPDGVRVMGEDEVLLDVLGKHLGEQKSALVSGGATVTDLSVYGRPAEEELWADRTREAVRGLNSSADIYGLEIAGSAEATLFTPLVHDVRKLHYQVFPRIAAFAEACWLPSEKRNYKDFRTRLDDLHARYLAGNLSPSAPYELPQRETLDGAVVTTSLTATGSHWPELVFDGKRETFFRAAAVKTGDHLTVQFPHPVGGGLSVATGGENGDLPSIFADGVLESSSDGTAWDFAADFFEGLANATLPEGTRFVRLRATGDQDHAFIVHEVTLAEPLLVPDLVDRREIRIAELVGEETKVTVIPVTFAVNFEKIPERRAEIAVMRRTYFAQWLQVVGLLGIREDPKTPHRFDLDPSKFGELSEADAADHLVAALVDHLRDYHEATPSWFASGFSAFIRKQVVPESSFAMSFPARIDAGEALAGGIPTAVFFEWFADKYSAATLTSVSQDCQNIGYREEVWKTFTGKTFEEILAEYRRK